MVRAPGLLEPFTTQIWISVRGWGRITGQGSCAFDLGSKVGGGGFEDHYFISRPQTGFQP